LSRGAGWLERAVIRAIEVHGWDWQKGGVSTKEICRFVHPDVEVIEKKHRVAVLQVLHRLMSNPPRPTEERTWMVRPAKKRGYWRQMAIPGAKHPDPRSNIAYHEAGHALAHLYLGYEIEAAAVLTWQQRWKQERILARLDTSSGYNIGFVQSRNGHEVPIAKTLIVLLAGPIAEAHYEGKWPWVRRGVSQTYPRYLTHPEVPTTDVARIHSILAELSDDQAQQTVILRRAQDLAQALIRSEPGWRFIKLLAAKMLDLKHGSLGHRRSAAVFREAFGRPPPLYGAWDNHWPPTLAQFRTGWLPP
jgi:hypothetical protein